jgi:DNA-binding transcriptional LysR family regulator
MAGHEPTIASLSASAADARLFLRQLEYLTALARERHFGRAAEACHVSQPALSAAIRKLEHELGVPLVNRQQRYDDLTPQGRALLPWAEQALASLDGLTAEAARLRQGLTGTLRLGVIPTALSVVSLITGPLLARHPGVRVEVRSLSSIEMCPAAGRWARQRRTRRLAARLRDVTHTWRGQRRTRRAGDRRFRRYPHIARSRSDAPASPGARPPLTSRIAAHTAGPPSMPPCASDRATSPPTDARAANARTPAGRPWRSTDSTQSQCRGRSTSPARRSRRAATPRARAGRP